MRSRYTAYYTGNIDYLIDTHHSSKRNLGDRLRLRQSIQNTRWLGLTIVKTRQGKPMDSTGVVEFVAICGTRKNSKLKISPAETLRVAGMSEAIQNSKLKTQNSKLYDGLSQLHERSRFIRQGQRWFYLDGTQLPPMIPARNQACWCGSGQKYKRCHGAKK